MNTLHNFFHDLTCTVMYRYVIPRDQLGPGALQQRDQLLHSTVPLLQQLHLAASAVGTVGTGEFSPKMHQKAAIRVVLVWFNVVLVWF